MKICKNILVVTLLVSSGYVMAKEKGDSYAGIAYQHGIVTYSGYDEVNPNGLQIHYGRYISSIIAIEGDFTLVTGTDDMSSNNDNSSIDLRLINVLSIFLKGELPNEKFGLYGKLGYTKGAAEGEENTSSTTYYYEVTESDLSFGIGLATKNNTGNQLYIEYINFIDKSDYTYSGINLGYSRFF